MFSHRIIFLIALLALISTVQAVSDGTYNINASKTGYTTVEDTVTVSGSGVKILVLHPEYNLTIKARDYSTTGVINTFYAYKDGIGTQSTNATVIYQQLDYGFYTVSVQADNYFPLQKTIFMSGDKEEIFDLTPRYTERAVHYVRFITQWLNGTRQPGISVEVYEGSDTTSKYNGTTGADGAIGFELTQSISYRITFINASLGVAKEIILYPVDSQYIIPLDEDAVSFVPGNISTNLTNYTTVYTNRSWSIQNLTSVNLTSDIGLGPLAQGILAGITNWVIVGAGGPITAIAATVIMALLGIVSWALVIFTSITVVSLYVLRGWIG